MTKELKEEIENDFDKKYSSILPEIITSGGYYLCNIKPDGLSIDINPRPVGFSVELLNKIRKIEIGQ